LRARRFSPNFSRGLVFAQAEENRVEGEKTLEYDASPSGV
jgi:hypothetical protein